MSWRQKASRGQWKERSKSKMEREEQSENSLHTIAIILLCCGAVKMLHLLGVITVEGKLILQLRSPEQALTLSAKLEGFYYCLSVSKLLIFWIMDVGMFDMWNLDHLYSAATF